MSQTKRLDKYWDIVIAALATLALIIVVGTVFDYYYEFNDDVLMKDILAGVYTGTPEALNIQMQAPVSAIIALFYRIVPSLPWYGYFLCFMHYGCLFLLIHRAVSLLQRKRSKVMLAVIADVLFAVIALPHLVMAQYTITVAIMAATASFLFYTIPEDLTKRQFIEQSVMPVIILFVAYLVRSEMLLLMLPYVAITGLVRWNKEKKMFSSENIFKYLVVAAAIVIGIGIGFVGNKVGYSSAEWKEFYRLFDNRTELYDYQYIPDYEENKDFYDGIELKRSQYNLLVNYDYAIDEAIDADMLGLVAEYAAGLRDDSILARIPGAVKMYLYRVIHFSDGLYSALTAILYVFVAIAIFARKDSTVFYKIKIFVLRVGGLIVIRSIPWMYIILGRRAPDRIVHSLYIIEIIILCGFLIVEGVSRLRNREFIMMIASVILFVGAVVTIPLVARSLKLHIETQDRINIYAQEIDEYCSKHPENFYFEDVYTTIRDGESFNQKMFENVDNSLSNYDLIGGWAANSPLFFDKLSNFGIKDVRMDLIEKDNVYLINDMEYPTDWIVELYADYGLDVVVEQTDTIARIFGVYQIRKQ